MHPFLDVTKLSLEEILDKLGKANVYLNQQSALGHTPTVLSIQEVIKYLEEERANRMQKQIDDENKKKNPEAEQPLEIGKVDKFDLEEFIRNSLL